MAKGGGKGSSSAGVIDVNYLGRSASTILAGERRERHLLISVFWSSFLSDPTRGGQVTHPAGAVHRPVLWAGGLSTAHPLSGHSFPCA